MAPYLVLFLIVVVLAFIAAWRFMPSGWLTFTTGTVGAGVVAFHDALLDMMPQLKAAFPPEWQPYLVVLMFLLTVAARFRKKVAAK